MNDDDVFKSREIGMSVYDDLSALILDARLSALAALALKLGCQLGPFVHISRPTDVTTKP